MSYRSYYFSKLIVVTAVMLFGLAVPEKPAGAAPFASAHSVAVVRPAGVVGAGFVVRRFAFRPFAFRRFAFRRFAFRPFVVRRFAFRPFAFRRFDRDDFRRFERR